MAPHVIPREITQKIIQKMEAGEQESPSTAMCASRCTQKAIPPRHRVKRSCVGSSARLRACTPELEVPSRDLALAPIPWITFPSIAWVNENHLKMFPTVSSIRLPLRGLQQQETP